MGKLVLKFERIVISVGIILWIITAFDLVRGSKLSNKSEDVVNTFCENVYYEQEALISVYGNLGKTYMSDAAKEIMLISVADKIGINKYTIKDEGESLRLVQNSRNGNVEIKLSTVDDTNYIYIGIALKSELDSVNAYKEIVEGICKLYGIKENVCVNLKGAKSGKLSLEQKDVITKNILSDMKAKEVISNKSEDIYTVYAYNKNIKEDITIAKKKININLTMYYDEENDLTRINLCTPINNEDF